jgi:hypothetical protein
MNLQIEEQVFTKEIILEKYLEFSSIHRTEDLPSEAEIKVLLENNCSCDYCGNSIFERNDFPNISVKYNSVECEECQSSRSRDIGDCALCEETLYYEDFEEYLDKQNGIDNETKEQRLENFFIHIGKSISEETGFKKGFYKVLDLPFYFGDIVTGFDGFIQFAIKFICGSKADKTETGEVCQECITKHNLKLKEKGLFYQMEEIINKIAANNYLEIPEPFRNILTISGLAKGIKCILSYYPGDKTEQEIIKIINTPLGRNYIIKPKSKK